MTALLTALLTIIVNLAAVAINAATSVDGRWPGPLEQLHRHPFWWSAGLTVLAVTVGVFLVWWQHGPPGPGPADSPTRYREIRQFQRRTDKFVGRTNVIAEIEVMLASPHKPIINIYGMPGTGKSALAMELGLRYGKDKDCHLLVDLTETTIDVALGRALTALGVQPSEIPAETRERAQEYRRRLWRYRPVVVIDNAVGSPDLGHVLPDQWQDAIVIITSWVPMVGLPGEVRAVRLDPMPPEEAMELLSATSGRTGLSRDPSVATVLAQTESLPLALAICGGLMRVLPGWTWADLVGRLTDEETGAVRAVTLELPSGALSVQRAFQAAYATLSPATAQAFCLLGLAPFPVMSTELPLAAFDGKRQRAVDLLHDLQVRQLVQVDGAVSRMHNLLWSWARERLKSVATEIRADAVTRVMSWAMEVIDTDYARWLRESGNRVAMLGIVAEHDFTLGDLYIETPLRMDGEILTLSQLFPGRRSAIILVGAGGSGKTTLVNHFSAACASGPVPTRALPVILFARDVRPGDEEMRLTDLLTRSLSERAGIHIPPDAFELAVAGGRLMVIIDGLDEVAESLRGAFVARIEAFRIGHPSVAVLVTTRPYAKLAGDLPGFTTAEVLAWSPALRRLYLERLSVSLRSTPWTADEIMNLLDSYDLQGMMGDPLVLQLLATVWWREGRRPASFIDVVESYVEQIILDREHSRVRNLVPPRILRRLWEELAYQMQTSTDERTSIGEDSVVQIAAQVGIGRRHVTGNILQVFAERRAGLINEVGPGRYAFRQTALREYFVASRLAGGKPEEAALVLSANRTDPAWASILTAVADLAARNREPEFLRDLLAAAAPQVRHMIRDHLARRELR
ncbi:NACHT domain-containing protein [Micromonospora sp. NPDC023737]|uniref:NACHT domain-containing protein n=1 Tax=unclassified Micromonospora TaxID=2617518 RepID=UPI0033EB995F